MTREIKFRYWDTKRNQMVGWESIKTFCRFGAVERMKHQIFQQYTGLKDKNGKEIYEGDIVLIKGHALQRDKRGIGIYIDGNYVVKWSEKMELILSVSLEDDDGWLLNRNVHYTEVIGNFFEHPHLIGGKHG